MILTLDLPTLAIVNAIVVLVCGIVFLLETIIRRSDEVGRLWSMFFIGMIFALFAYIVGASQPTEAWWAFAAGNGAFVGSLGLVWEGARRANRRRGLVVGVFVAAVATVGAGLLHGPGHGYWTGAVELFLGAALFCGLSAFELTRGSLGRLPSARLLAIGLAIMTIYYVTRAVGFVVLGPQDPVWDAVYGAATSTLIETALTALGAMTLSSMQADRFRAGGVNDADFGTTVTIDGILGAEQFRALTESWLVRSIRSRSTLVFLLVELADLSEVNLAFGRAAGDAAIRLTGRVALLHAPTASLVGHLSPRRFALVMELSTSDSVDAIADRIGDSVLSTPVDEQDRFRASTFKGVATTRTSGARYADLYRAAADAVAADKARARALAEQDLDALSRPDTNLSGN
jgi:GGDEF domain-containing protein